MKIISSDQPNQKIILPLISKSIRIIIPEFCAAMLIISIFLTTIDLIQYLVTEYWWLIDSIYPQWNTIFLLALIFLASFINWKNIIGYRKKTSLIIFASFLFIVGLHLIYRKYYDYLLTFPKIREVSNDWGIHGSWVKVKGKNFGHPHQVGSIYVGNEKMNIKKWTDKEIIFSIPAISSEFGNIKIINSHQNTNVEEFPFTIKDTWE